MTRRVARALPGPLGRARGRTPGGATGVALGLAWALGLALSLSLSLAAPSPARADGLRPRSPVPPAYAQECGACHVAYVPGLLRAPSWQRLMAGLPRHFGSDASLDDATTRALADWLQREAATGGRWGMPPPQDRITRSARFERKHRDLGAEVWRRPAVRSPANCSACHPRADQGDFDDDHVRVPR